MSNPLATVICPNLPGSLNGVSSAAEFQFTDSKGNVAKLSVPGPIAAIMDGRPIKVKAFGRATGQASATTLVIKIDYGVDSTIGNNTILVTSTARAITAASHNFIAEAVLMWDSTSKKIQGVQTAMIANLVDAPAAVTAIPTSVDFTKEGLGFTVTGTMSTAHANNVAVLTGFELELL